MTGGWERADVVAYLQDEARFLCASDDTVLRRMGSAIRSLADAIAEGAHVGHALAGFDSDEV